MIGWIKLYRTILNNQLWTSEPFTRGQAWVDLLLLANHEDSFFYLRDHKINVKRGQVGWSQLKLSERWKWSRNKVKKFLNDLEKEQQIEQQQSKSTSVITIINYEKYQQKEQQVEQQVKQQVEQQEDNSLSIDKEDKNNKEDKKDKKKDLIDQVIDVFSDVYKYYFDLDYEISKGKDRSAASRMVQIYKRQRPGGDTDNILEGLRNFFSKCCQVQDDWILKNMSLPIVVSKINEINKLIRFGGSQAKRLDYNQMTKLAQDHGPKVWQQYRRIEEAGKVFYIKK